MHLLGSGLCIHSSVSRGVTFLADGSNYLLSTTFVIKNFTRKKKIHEILIFPIAIPQTILLWISSIWESISISSSVPVEVLVYLPKAWLVFVPKWFLLIDPKIFQGYLIHIKWFMVALPFSTKHLHRYRILRICREKRHRRYSNRLDSASCENAITSQRLYQLTVNVNDRKVIDKLPVSRLVSASRLLCSSASLSFHDRLDNGENFVDSCLRIVYETHDYI